MPLHVSDFVDPMRFFQAVHDAPELQLDENSGAASLLPRASSLANCAREIAHAMAGTPKSNPQREDREQVAQQYANEQGRLAEELSFIALQNQAGMPLRLQVVGKQDAIEPRFATGHPDGSLIWLLPDESYFTDEADIPEERFYFTAEMFGREPDGERYKVGVEHKHPGVNTYGRIAGSTVAAERPGWVYQAIVYGEDKAWDYVLFIDVALDATAIRSPRLGYLKHFKDPLEHKAKFDLIDVRQLRAGFLKQLQKRAKALTKTVWPEGVVDDKGSDRAATVQRQYNGAAKFPCGYCEYRDRCNIEGDGVVPIPAAPLG